MALQFGQIEIGTQALFHKPMGVMEEKQPEIHQRSRHWDVANHHMAFHKVKTTRSHHKQRCRRIQTVDFILCRMLVGDGPGHRISEIDLAMDHILPGRRTGVFKIGHKDVSATI